MIKLLKLVLQGLLLAACFAGGYYWSLSLRQDAQGPQNPSRMVSDAVSDIHETGKEILEEIERGDAPTDLPLAVEDTSVKEPKRLDKTAEPEPVESTSEAFNVAMRNSLDALRKLRE